MKKPAISMVLTLIICITVLPLTALAAVLPGCPDDGGGMDMLWGNKHMEISRQLTEYAEATGWTGHARLPQGWTNYTKYPGSIAIRNYTNVEDGQWWQLEFTLNDDAFNATLKLYYWSGVGTVGSVVSEISAGSGRLSLDELKTAVDDCTAKIGAPFASDLLAASTTSTVLINGGKVAFDAYTINGNNYFKLRDLAYVLSGTEKQFEVSWDGANNAINLTSGKAYTVVGGEMSGKGTGTKTPVATASTIYMDGKQVSLTAYTIDGSNYFKLRDIGKAFDFGVEWDGANNTIVINTSAGYTAD